jgi:hypothetical protein
VCGWVWGGKGVEGIVGRGAGGGGVRYPIPLSIAQTCRLQWHLCVLCALWEGDRPMLTCVCCVHCVEGHGGMLTCSCKLTLTLTRTLTPP